MPKKILIVEDCPDLGGALKRLFEMEGYAAVVAMTATEGHERAVAEPPDLILLDVALPDYDGIRLTRELRSLARTAAVPILCVSSYTGWFEEDALAAGCDAVFSKSKFISDYASTLRQFLS